MNTYSATGRRKESVARIRLKEGEKGFVVNERSFETYFPRENHRIRILQPLQVTHFEDRFRVEARVAGGGLSGQAGAIRLGIARALLEADENVRSILRKGGFLTRDPRAKERKKFGRKGARRSFQYTKR